MKEELGPEVNINVSEPVATWIRPWIKKSIYIFLIGFECEYVGGEIKLSDEHLSYRWVTQQESYQLPLGEGYREALDQFWKNK